MGGKTGALIGLEHIVCPAVRGCECQVRIQDLVRIAYIVVRGPFRASAGARVVGAAVHPAGSSLRVEVAHVGEAKVCVIGIVNIIERDGGGIGSTGGGCLIQPVAGLNVVLGAGRAGAAGTAVAERRRAQTLKKIVGTAVFLDDHDDVLKTGDLSVGEYCSTETQENQTCGSKFQYQNVLLLR